MFVSLKNLLPQEIARRGMAPALAAATVCKAFRDLIPQLFSKDAVDFMDARSYKDGTLTVHVLDGAWAKLIIDHKDEIIQKLNTTIRSTIVKNVKPKVGMPQDMKGDLTEIEIEDEDESA